jgi:NADH-quinone oxidoreductase subunit J
MNLIGFIVLSALAIFSALVVVAKTNPVVSALSLAFNLCSIAGFYLLLHAQFLALLQVIVYAGAIMVLILFVIMLLNLPLQAHRSPGFFQRWLAPVLGLVFVVILGWALSTGTDARTFPPLAEGFGTVESVGSSLFTQFFYAFEAISLLLVVAMIGAVLLAKKRL